MFPEEIIIEKAERYYQIFKGSAHNTLSINQRVTFRLSEMMIDIWNEWQQDTRHYKPSKQKHEVMASHYSPGGLGCLYDCALFEAMKSPL